MHKNPYVAVCITYYVITTNNIKPEDDAAESGKPGFVNLKRVIWHTAFHEILRSIEHHAEFGTSITCGDGVKRQIFPRIIIISADYEEQ